MKPDDVTVRPMSILDVSRELSAGFLTLWGTAGPTTAASVNWVLGVACVWLSPLAAGLLLALYHRAPMVLLAVTETLRVSNAMVVWTLGLAGA